MTGVVRKDDGFTLTELLIVVTLTGLIMTVLTASLLLSFRVLLGVSDTSDTVGVQDRTQVDAQLDASLSIPTVSRTWTSDIQNATLTSLQVGASGCSLPATADTLGGGAPAALVTMLYSDTSVPATEKRVDYLTATAPLDRRRNILRIECAADGGSASASTVLRGLDALTSPSATASAGSATLTFQTVQGRSYSLRAVARLSLGGSFSTPGDLATVISSRAEDTPRTGRITSITVTFSETLNSSCDDTPSAWSVASATANGEAVSAVTVSGSNAVLTVSGGVMPDTSNDNLTFSFDASLAPASCRIGSFSGIQPFDGAAPVLTAVTDTPGTIDGQAQSGDTLVLTFSEPLDPMSLPDEVLVTLRDPTGQGANTIRVTAADPLDARQLSNGPLSLGSKNYLGSNRTAIFAGVLNLDEASGPRNLTIALGGCTGQCGANDLKPGTGSLLFIPASNITDLSENPAVALGSSPSQLARVF